MENKESVFATLSAINVAQYVEKKGQFNYLSWAYAWGILKAKYPKSIYTIYENEHGMNYHSDKRTAWVKCGVTVEGIEHIEYLPIMDFKNKAKPLMEIDSMDVNKSIQRALTKAVARHGLGLKVYAGEDLPQENN